MSFRNEFYFDLMHDYILGDDVVKIGLVMCTQIGAKLKRVTSWSINRSRRLTLFLKVCPNSI